VGHGRIRVRVVGCHPAHDLGGPLQVRLRHDVRVQVVVDDGAVLVRAGHPMKVEALLRAAEEAEIGIEASRLDEHGESLATQEPGVGVDVGVLAQGPGHVRVDVVLGGAGGVVGRSFFAVDGAPREQGSPLRHLPGALSRLVEHGDAEPQGLPRELRVGVGEEGNQVHLGVPEVVPLVTRRGHSLGCDAAAVHASGRLGQLEQTPTDRLLQLGLRVHLDVGAGPVVGQPRLLLGLEGRDPALPRSGHIGLRGPDKLTHVALRVAVCVTDPRHQRDGFARRSVRCVGAPRQVGVAPEGHHGGRGAAELVVGDHRQTELGRRGAIAG